MVRCESLWEYLCSSIILIELIYYHIWFIPMCGVSSSSQTEKPKLHKLFVMHLWRLCPWWNRLKTWRLMPWTASWVDEVIRALGILWILGFLVANKRWLMGGIQKLSRQGLWGLSELRAERRAGHAIKILWTQRWAPSSREEHGPVNQARLAGSGTNPCYRENLLGRVRVKPVWPDDLFNRLNF